jgi:hypothetical protein
MAAFTENGALSLASTGSPHVDFFFKVLRDSSVKSIHSHLEKAWAVNPTWTLILIFYLRDCRGGKGERKAFIECYKWLIEKDIAIASANIKNIVFFGRYKDLFEFMGTKLESHILDYYATQLNRDLSIFHSNNASSISLAAKWAPSEGSALDKKYHCAKHLSKRMGMDLRAYRKMLAELRAYLSIVEVAMCDRQWDSITYSKVASYAMKKYRKAFMKHDESRFQQFLHDVTEGKASIKAKQLFPHEIINAYKKTLVTDDVLEAQWNELIKNINPTSNSLVLCDVSGSMGSPIPGSKSAQNIDVSIALSLILADKCQGTFHNKVITFEETPHLVNITGDSLRDRMDCVKSLPWGGNTNLQAAFDLILNAALMYNTPQEHMPQTLWIVSDMQFDFACRQKTNYHLIEEKYRKSGYKRPRVIFWNVAGDTLEFPAYAHDPNTNLVSGFSPSVMQLCSQGELISPYQLMLKVIKNPRYECILFKE